MHDLSLLKFKLEHLEAYFKKTALQAIPVQHNAMSQFSNNTPIVLPLQELRRLQLQPPFAANGDKHYHVDDLLKFQDRNFIENAYLAILNRPPDHSGSASYLEALRSGKISKIEVLERLRHSPEGNRQSVVINGLPEQIKKSRLKQWPYVGYVIHWLIVLLTLPRLPRDYSRLSTHIFAWFEETVSYLNLLTNQINVQLKDVSKAQIQLQHKLSEQLAEITSDFKEQSSESREHLDKLSSRFNNNLDAALDKQRTELSNVFDEKLGKQHVEINSFLSEELNKQGAELSGRLGNQDEQQRQMSEQISQSNRILQTQLGEALIATERLRVELAAHRRRVGELERTIKFSQNNVTPIDSSALIESRSAGNLLETPSESELDEFFVAFAEKFRGSREAIKNRLRVYLPFVEKALNGFINSDDLIVDLACGRGEWLELLAEQGWHAIGVDTNRFLIESCLEQGLDAVQMDAPEYLKSLPDKSCVCITGMHIIEHLPLEALITFINQIMRVLRPGGAVIFETPNPDNLQVGSRTFYFDPTHRNPLPALLVEFMLETLGFTQIEIMPLHPWEDAKLPEESAAAQRINELFYGPMDYGIIGWRQAN